jgi:hypothetical protein
VRAPLSTPGIVEARFGGGISDVLDEQWLLDRVLEGLTVEEIVRRTSVSAATVRKQLRVHGIPEPKGRRPAVDPARVRELHDEIARGVELISRSWVWLAERLHAFHELRGWEVLGFDALEHWLRSPGIGLSRSQFFRLVRVWRRLVVDHEVRPERLHGASLERLDVISRADGELPVEEALADVRELTMRELVAKYRGKLLPPVGECPTCHRPLPRKRGRPSRRELEAA